jgi:hypothetical protein
LLVFDHPLTEDLQAKHIIIQPKTFSAQGTVGTLGTLKQDPENVGDDYIWFLPLKAASRGSIIIIIDHPEADNSYQVIELDWWPETPIEPVFAEDIIKPNGDPSGGVSWTIVDVADADDICTLTVGTLDEITIDGTVEWSSAASSFGTLTYQWHESTSAGFTPGTANVMSGKTAATLVLGKDKYLPEDTDGVAYYYVCVVTNINSNAWGSEKKTIVFSDEFDVEYNE